MTVVAVDDTDSRTRGMCTTYVGHRIAARLADRGVAVHERRLVRLNPAAPYKTRGNAAVAVRATVDPAVALAVARETVTALAAVGDDRTNPGVVVADRDEPPAPVADLARRALREDVDPGEARALAAAHGYRTATWGSGRGLVGALAAVGWPAVATDWTHERIAYRTPERRGTDRTVDAASVRAAADAAYPAVWDTVDRVAGETVCVPNTPGPVLYGIRGDDPDVVDRVAAAIDCEPVAASARFRTNQGTDAHLAAGTIGTLRDGRGYRVDGVVNEGPTTRAGGHVHLTLEAPADGSGSGRLPCVAFEPTGRFRDRVRGLRVGDRVTACGEVGDETLKLEKLAVRELVRETRTTPTCPDCGTRMESAGADQGWRCRDCDRHAADRARRTLDRELAVGWYEVPPRARRHVAKPLVRGGFDAPTHPER